MPRGSRRRTKVIADLSIYPIGAGSSLSRYVRTALRAMRRVRGLRLVPAAMSTAMEADDLATILRGVRVAHDALVRMGSPRIAINFRADHRLDKAETIAYKVGRIRGVP